VKYKHPYELQTTKNAIIKYKTMSNPTILPEALWRAYHLDLTETITRANEIKEEIRQQNGGNVHCIVHRQLELDNMVAEINLAIMVKTYSHAIACDPLILSVHAESDPDVVFDLYDTAIGIRSIQIPCSELKKRIQDKIRTN
jgi:hypothetical protein